MVSLVSAEQWEEQLLIPYYTSDRNRKNYSTKHLKRLKRSKKVTSVDKANVLESSRMWREIAEEKQKTTRM